MDVAFQVQENFKAGDIPGLRFEENGWLDSMEELLAAILVLVMLNIWSHFCLYRWIESFCIGARFIYNKIFCTSENENKSYNFATIGFSFSQEVENSQLDKKFDASCIGDEDISCEKLPRPHLIGVLFNKSSISDSECQSFRGDNTVVSNHCSEEQGGGDLESLSLGQRVQEVCQAENKTLNTQFKKSLDLSTSSNLGDRGGGDLKTNFDDINQSNHVSSNDRNCVDFRNSSSPPKTSKKSCKDLFTMWRGGSSATSTSVGTVGCGHQENKAAFLLRTRPSSACGKSYSKIHHTNNESEKSRDDFKYVSKPDTYCHWFSNCEKGGYSFETNKSVIESKPPSGITALNKKRCLPSSEIEERNKQGYFRSSSPSKASMNLDKIKTDFDSNTRRFLMASSLDSFNRFGSSGYFTNCSSFEYPKYSNRNCKPDEKSTQEEFRCGSNTYVTTPYNGNHHNQEHKGEDPRNENSVKRHSKAPPGIANANQQTCLPSMKNKLQKSQGNPKSANPPKASVLFGNETLDFCSKTKRFLKAYGVGSFDRFGTSGYSTNYSSFVNSKFYNHNSEQLENLSQRDFRSEQSPYEKYMANEKYSSPERKVRCPRNGNSAKTAMAFDTNKCSTFRHDRD